MMDLPSVTNISCFFHCALGLILSLLLAPRDPFRALKAALLLLKFPEFGDFRMFGLPKWLKTKE
jgi:hypothetical protein